MTKVFRFTSRAAPVAKGSVDFAEAVLWQYTICTFILAVIVTADTLQICTSFIPGPNVTTIVTMPVSISCKVFVWCCKKSKLPWGSC